MFKTTQVLHGNRLRLAEEILTQEQIIQISRIGTRN